MKNFYNHFKKTNIGVGGLTFLNNVNPLGFSMNHDPYMPRSQGSHPCPYEKLFAEGLLRETQLYNVIICIKESLSANPHNSYLRVLSAMVFPSFLPARNMPLVVKEETESFFPEVTSFFKMFDNPDWDSLDVFETLNNGGIPKYHQMAGDGFQARKIFCLSPEGGFVEWTSHLQHLGETSFVAAILIAMIQAAVALHQYRSNPKGELIFPQGLTCGVENANKDDVQSYPKNIDISEANDASQVNPFQHLKSLNEDANRMFLERNKGKIRRFYSLFLFKVNRMLVLLFPWVAKRINYLLLKNSHLLHIFFIISLASAFDFGHTGREVTNNDSQDITKTLNRDEKEECKLVVIGDSLAIGIGCVENWDVNKNQSKSKHRVEKLYEDMDDKSENNDSPVFPLVFAKTLSKRLNRRIRWRSAGVDGGNVVDIRKFCTGVIQEETDNGKPPDIVVVLCGINDLKEAISNPFRAKSARGFRKDVEDLIESIRKHAPNASIVLPALPVQLFHKNSIVNILPLSFFLDAIIGYWDSRKRLVADRNASHVIYVGLRAREISNWYNGGEEDDSHTIALIASDGVHPNRRCYTKWAASIANKLCDRFVS